jgi:zinc D-Ala-D-Ala carboxypeptidase
MSLPITAHLALGEFTCRDGTPYPAEWIGSRLKPLCDALEVIRERAGGRPIKINSGFRTRSYNVRIGGARLSQHVEGRAADFTIAGMTPAAVHDLVIALVRDGAIKIGGCGAYNLFTHVDVRPSVRLVRWSGSRADG